MISFDSLNVIYTLVLVKFYIIKPRLKQYRINLTKKRVDLGVTECYVDLLISSPNNIVQYCGNFRCKD